VNRLILVGIAVVLIVTPLSFLPSILSTVNQGQNNNYLKQNGINGTAVIESASNTQTWINGNPLVKFTLNVTVHGKAPYEANCSQAIPQINLAQCQPGDKVYVLVDPKNPQNLMLS